MADSLIFGEDELRFLQELRRHKVPFLVVGLSAATLQGAPVVTQDVDLWFKDPADARLKRALAAVGGIYVPPMGLNPPMLAGDHVKLFDVVVYMHGLRSFDEEYRHAAKIRIGRVLVPVLPLPRIIASKEAANRSKDRLTLTILRDVARTRQKGR